VIACLSEYRQLYTFAEVNSVNAHRIERADEKRRDAVATARLLREALLLKLAETESRIESCRHRVDAIEGRFGLTQAELDSALARRSLAISEEEAAAWHAELELLDALAIDRQLLLAILG